MKVVFPVTNKIKGGALIACCAFYAAAVSAQNVDATNSAIIEIQKVEFELAVAQKEFSTMKETMPPTEKCLAKDLLAASLGYREVIDEARAVGVILADMKSPDDQNAVRRHLGRATSRVLALSEGYVGAANELFGAHYRAGRSGNSHDDSRQND
jgi:hypothetical protein